MGIPHSFFEEKLEAMKDAKRARLDTDLSVSDLKELVEQYKQVYIESTGEKFPSDPK
ncbi:Pyruvate, phosphate dikinase, chloroplastic [Linum perenne]